MAVRGLYYAQGSSEAQAMIMDSDDHGTITLQSEQGVSRYPAGHFDQLQISPRIGSSARAIRFADGGLLETNDNDGVDLLLRQHQKSRNNGFVHRLESSYRTVFLAAAGCLGVLWLLLTVVLPYSAQKLALNLPDSVATSVGQGTMEVMDELYFQHSELSESDQQRLTKLFDAMAVNADADYPFRLLFRSSEQIGANAFALPDGTVVVTDDFIALAENDQQVQSVLAHEIGHVIHRHSLRRVLQTTGLSIIMILVTGDVVSTANLVALLPGILLESSYSRSMETEADQYALTYMKSNGLPPKHFADIMTLMMTSHEGKAGGPEFLSSHPDTQERIKPFIE
ncbi:peptidase M48 Ste24p [Endozoicomonas sp. OPT23]|uniref:M48 family metallopeptidase n=1 Tax=Endozoicomonas sp. OPT23 TaxID=2072845 RepID=UPI00129AF375|nr:M48 family metallopeptidase [Endozoicomonas sp. OPT23]MRI34940.1 peptidase M48 Ste24p [Endozoicomonas sp. OPT23]